eukprot:TRINITY_DN2720_c0_g1_i1.p4 TRINITY_DN2720_c0_g1~~TRINITY_DN2720_c0_g1_i1.p4  ORF type:complete len:178 (-),score=16.86 TRINITY_DN2720_c0_g1_i1:527-1060(-)
MQQHQSAKWPDEQAKLYFVQKFPWAKTLEEQQPQSKKKPKPPTTTKKLTNKLLTSGVYKKSIPYKVVENEYKVQEQQLQLTQNEQRYCLNWGCETIYKESENRKGKQCICHQGTWDFGYTGMTLTEAQEAYKNKSKLILWEPQWTCCRGEWNSKGCLKTYHKGPLISKMQPELHPFK